jgi:hypothetical protein
MSIKPSYGALNSKINKFQMIVAQRNMRHVPTTCTNFFAIDLIYEDFIKFYNLIRSNHVLESHVI